MGVVPRSRLDRTNKYSADQVATLARHVSPSKPGMELLLCEWSTSGRVRPTLSDLYALCKEVEEERAAAFVFDLMGGKQRVAALGTYTKSTKLIQHYLRSIDD